MPEFKDQSRRKGEERGEQELSKKVDDKRNLQDVGKVERRNGDDEMSARPNGLRENADSSILGWGPGPTG